MQIKRLRGCIEALKVKRAVLRKKGGSSLGVRKYWLCQCKEILPLLKTSIAEIIRSRPRRNSSTNIHQTTSQPP